MSNFSKEVVLDATVWGKVFPRLKIFPEHAVADITTEDLASLGSESSLAIPRNSEKTNSWALQDINFKLRRGECWDCLAEMEQERVLFFGFSPGILKQDYGSFEVNGSIGGIIALGAGFNSVSDKRENLKVYVMTIKGISQKILQQKEEENESNPSKSKFFYRLSIQNLHSHAG